MLLYYICVLVYDEYLVSYTDTSSKWIVNLNVKVKDSGGIKVELSREKQQITFMSLGEYLNRTGKALTVNSYVEIKDLFSKRQYQ